jgi:hypothetical protein
MKFSPELEAAVMAGLERDLSKRARTVESFVTRFCAAAEGDKSGKKKGFLSSFFGKDNG